MHLRVVWTVVLLATTLVCTTQGFIFNTRADLNVGDNLRGYATGVLCDITNDGYPELVMPNTQTGGPHILMWTGPGLQTWTDMTATWMPALTVRPWGAAALCQDIDQDGNMDLVIMSYENEPYATILRGPVPFTVFQTFYMWTGTPPTPISPYTGTSGIPYMAGIADLNCDGYTDVVVDLENRGIVFLENLADVMFHTVPTFGGLSQWSGQGDYGGIADISNDGYVDLITRQWVSFTDTWISIPNGGGDVSSFTEIDANTTQHVLNQYGGVCFADFWKRGALDIAMTGASKLTGFDRPGIFKSVDNGVSWSFVSVNTDFEAGGNDYYNSIVCEDFNNDGYPDIAVSDKAKMHVYINDLVISSSFTLDGEQDTANKNDFYGGLMAADIDLDGDVDLFGTRYDSKPRVYPNEYTLCTSPTVTPKTFDPMNPPLDTVCTNECTGFHVYPKDINGAVLVNARVGLYNDTGDLIAGIRETHGGWSHGSQPYSRLHFGLGGFDPSTTPMYIKVTPSCGQNDSMVAICPGDIECVSLSSYQYEYTYDSTYQNHLTGGLCDIVDDYFVLADWRLAQTFDVLANDGLIYNTPLNTTDLRVSIMCLNEGCLDPFWGYVDITPGAKRASGDLVTVNPGPGQPPKFLYFTYQICHEFIPNCCQIANVTIEVTPPCTLDPTICTQLASTCGTGVCDPGNVTSDNWGCVYTPNFSGNLEPNCTFNGYSCASGFCHPDGYCAADLNDGICYIERCTLGFCDPFNVTGNVQPITGCGGMYTDGTPCQDLNANLSMSTSCYGNATCQAGVCVLSNLNDAECASEYECWQSGTCGGDPNDWFLKPIAWISQEGGDRNDNNINPVSSTPFTPELAQLLNLAGTLHDEFGYRVGYLDGDVLVTDTNAYRMRTGAAVIRDGVFWQVDQPLPGMVWIYQNTLENAPRFAKTGMITIKGTDLPLVDQALFNDTLLVGESSSSWNYYTHWRSCTGMDAWVDTDNNKQWVVCAGTTRNPGSNPPTTINDQFGVEWLLTVIFFERNNNTGVYSVNTVLTFPSGTLTSLTEFTSGPFPTSRQGPSTKVDAIKGWNGVAVFHMSVYSRYGGWFVGVNSTTNEQCQWWQTFRYNATLDSWSEVSYWNDIGNCMGQNNNMPYNNLNSKAIQEYHDMSFTLAGLQPSVWNGIAAHLVPHHDMYSSLAPSPVMGIWDISVTPPSFIQALQIGQDNLPTVATHDVRNTTRFANCMGDGFLVVARLCTLESRRSIDCLWVYEWDGAQFTNEQQLTFPERSYLNQTVALYKYVSCAVDANRIVAVIMRSLNDTEMYTSGTVPQYIEMAYVEYYHRSSFLAQPTNHYDFVGARRLDAPYGTGSNYNTDAVDITAVVYGSQVTLGEGVDYQFAFIGIPKDDPFSFGNGYGQGIVAVVCLDFQDGCTRGCEVSHVPYYPNPAENPENAALNTPCTPHLVSMCYAEDAYCYYGDCRVDNRNQTCMPNTPALDSDCCFAWCDTYLDCVELMAPTGFPCINDNLTQCEQDATCQAFVCVKENGGTCEFDSIDASGTCVNETNGCYVGMCNGVDDFCPNQVYTPARCTSLYGGPFGNGEFTARSYESCPTNTTVVLSHDGCEVNCVMDESYVDMVSNDIQCPNHPGCGYDTVCPSKTNTDYFFCTADSDCTGYLLPRECVEPRCIASICTYAPLLVNTVCDMTSISANLSCTGTAGKCDGRGSCVPDVFTLPENTCYDVCGFSACNDGLWYTDFDNCTTEYKCMGYPNAIVTEPDFGYEFLGQTPLATAAFANNNVTYPGACFWNYECGWGSAMKSGCSRYCSYTAGPGPLIANDILPDEYYCRHDICNMAPRGICSLETFECLGNVTAPNPICTDPGCYIKVVLVIDTTDSLTLAEKQVVLDTMQAVIPLSLGGTFATIAIVPFGGYAYSLCTYNRMDTISGINDYLDCVNNVYRNNVTLAEIAGFTNWASAFSIVANSIVAPELVIFFSDGEPNRYEDAILQQIERVRVRGTVIRGICVSDFFPECVGFSTYVGAQNVDWKYAPSVSSVAQTMADIIHEQNITGCEPYNPPCEMVMTNNLTCDCTVVPDPGAVNETCYSGQVCVYDGYCDTMGNCIANNTAPDGTPCDPDPQTDCGTGMCLSGMCDITEFDPGLCTNVTAVNDCFFVFPNVVPDGTVIDVLANDLGDYDPMTLINITAPSPVGTVVVDMGVFKIYGLPTMMSGNITFTYQICGINPISCDTAIVCITFTIPTPCMNMTYNCSNNAVTDCIPSWVCMDGPFQDVNGCSPVFAALGTTCTDGISDCAGRECDGAGTCVVVSTNDAFCINPSYPCLNGTCLGVEAANYTHERIGIIRCPDEFLPPQAMQVEFNQTDMFLTHKVIDRFLFWGQVDGDREIGRLVIYERENTIPIHYNFFQIFQQGNCQPAYLNFKSNAIAGDVATNGDILATVFLEAQFFPIGLVNDCNYTLQDMRYNPGLDMWEIIGYDAVGPATYKCKTTPNVICNTYGSVQWGDVSVQVVDCDNAVTFELRFEVRKYNGTHWNVVDDGVVVELDSTNITVTGFDVVDDRVLITTRNDTDNSATVYVYRETAPDTWTLDFSSMPIGATVAPATTFECGWPGACLGDGFFIQNLDVAPHPSITNGIAPMDSFMLFTRVSEFPDVWDAGVVYKVPDNAIYNSTLRSKFACDVYADAILAAQAWPSVDGFVGQWHWNVATTDASFVDVFGLFTGPADAYIEPNIGVQLSISADPHYAFVTTTYRHANLTLPDMSDQINIYCIDPLSNCTFGCANFFNDFGSCVDTVIGNDKTICDTGFCVADGHTDMFTNATECLELITDPFCVSLNKTTPCFGCEFQQKPDGQVRGPGVDDFCQYVYCTGGGQSFGFANNSLCVNPPGDCWIGTCDANNTMTGDGCTYVPKPVDTPCTVGGETSCEMSMCDNVGNCLFGQNATLCEDGNDCTWDVCIDAVCSNVNIDHSGGQNYFWGPYQAVQTAPGVGTLPFADFWIENSPVAARTDGQIGWEYNITGPSDVLLSPLAFKTRLLKLDMSIIERLIVTFTITDQSTQNGDAFRNTHIVGVQNTDNITYSDTNRVCLEIFAPNYNYAVSANVTSCDNVVPAPEATQMLITNPSNITTETLSFIVDGPTLTTSATEIYLEHRAEVQGGSTLFVDVLVSVYIEAIVKRNCVGDFNCSALNVCEAGVCVAGPPPDCYVADECGIGFCNVTTNACETYYVPEGTVCNDDDYCSVNETCQVVMGNLTCVGVFTCPDYIAICGEATCAPNAVAYNASGSTVFVPDELRARVPGIAVERDLRAAAFTFFKNQVRVACTTQQSLDLAAPNYPQFEINAINVTSDSRFGADVSMSGDANVIVIGAPGDVNEVIGNNYYPLNYPYPDGLPPLYVNRTGDAFVYVKNSLPEAFENCTFEFQQLLLPNDLGEDSQFGWRVAVSEDGGVIAVSGPAHNNGMGAVWIFVRDTLTSKYKQTGGGGALSFTGAVGSQVMFGTSISLSSDGTYLAVGAPGDDSKRGAVWIFTGTSASSAWTQVGSKLVGTAGLGSPMEMQGRSVSLSTAGRDLIVGGSMDTFTETPGTDLGSVWVWRRVTAVMFVQTYFITPGTSFNLGGVPAGLTVGNFGSSVSVSNDGLILGVSGRELNSTITPQLGRTIFYYRMDVASEFIYADIGINYGYRVRVAGSGAGAIMGSHTLTTLAYMEFAVGDCLNVTSNSLCDDGDGKQCTYGNCTGAIDECIQYYNQSLCQQYVTECMPVVVCDPNNGTADFVDPLTGCAFFFASNGTSCNGGITGNCTVNTCQAGLCVGVDTDSLCDDASTCTDDTCLGGSCLYAIHDLWSPCNDLGFNCTKGYCGREGICYYVFNDTFCDNEPCYGGSCDPFSPHDAETGCTVALGDGADCYPSSPQCYSNATCSGGQCIPSGTFDDNVCSPDPLDTCVVSGTCTGDNDFLRVVHTLSTGTNNTFLLEKNSPFIYMQMYADVVVGDYILVATESHFEPTELYTVPNAENSAIEILVHQRVPGFQPAEWGLVSVYGKPVTSCNLGGGIRAFPVDIRHTVTSDGKEWIIKKNVWFDSYNGTYPNLVFDSNPPYHLLGWELDVFEWYGNGTLRYDSTVVPFNQTNVCSAWNMRVYGDLVLMGIFPKCMVNLVTPLVNVGGVCNPITSVRYFPSNGSWICTQQYDPYKCSNTVALVGLASNRNGLEPLMIDDKVFYVIPNISPVYVNYNEIMVFDLLAGDVLVFNKRVDYVDIVGAPRLAIPKEYATSNNNTKEIMVNEFYNTVEFSNVDHDANPWYFNVTIPGGLRYSVHITRPVIIKWNGTDLLFSQRLEYVPPQLLFTNNNSTYDTEIISIYNADFQDGLLLCAYISSSVISTSQSVLLNEKNSYVTMFVRNTIVDAFIFVGIMDPYTGVPFPYPYQEYYIYSTCCINAFDYGDGGFLISSVSCDESFAYITVSSKGVMHGQNSIYSAEQSVALYVFCIRPEGCSKGCSYTFEPDFTPCVMYPEVSCLTSAECFNHECQTTGVSNGEPIINHPLCTTGLECEETVCVEYVGCMNICADFLPADVVVGPFYRDNTTIIQQSAVDLNCFYDVCFRDDYNVTIPCNGTSNYTCIASNECVLRECIASNTTGECTLVNTECILYECDLDQVSPPNVNTTTGCFPATYLGSETSCTYAETCVISAACDSIGGCNVTATNQTVCDIYAQSVGGTCNYAICNVSDPNRDPVTGCALMSNNTVCEILHDGFCVTNTYCNNSDPLRNLTDSCVVQTQPNGTFCNQLGYTCTPGMCVAEECAYIFNHTECNQEPCNNGTCNPFAMEFDNVTGCADNFFPIGYTCIEADLCTNYTCMQIMGDPVNHTECVATDYADGTMCQIGVNSTCENSLCMSGVCIFNATDALCDDMNVCTDQACMSDGFSQAICVYGYNTDPCTVAELGSNCENSTCANGTCVLGGSDSFCDDMNVCVTNVCEVNTTANTAICMDSNNTNTCDTDSYACTYQLCIGGECITFLNNTYCGYLNASCVSQTFCDPGFPGHFADGCNQVNYPLMWPCTIDPGNDCEMSACNGMGGCEFATNAGLCNDMNVCTSETCLVNMTATTAICNYTNVPGPCTYPGQSGDCLDSMCNAGMCELQGNNATCDDSNVCTDEFCFVNTTAVTATCQRSNNTDPCDTDIAQCTVMTCGNGTCNTFYNDSYCGYLLGPCVELVFCNDTEPGSMADGCNVVFKADLTPCSFDPGNTCEDSFCDTGVCIFDTDPAACDDSNVCTDEVCNSNSTAHTAICEYTNNTDPCSYGMIESDCEQSVCGGGTCNLAGNASLCFDGNVCTDDVCNVNGTEFTAICSNPNNTGPCTDTYSCTDTQCGGGTCNIIAYNDSVCPTDLPMCWDDIICDPDGPDVNTTTGCSAVYSANGTSCSFSEGASDCEDSTCMNGMCELSYSSTLCDDNNYCTIDVCNYIIFPLVFTCSYTPMDSLCSDLADGLCVTGGHCNTTDPNAYPPGHPRSGCVPDYEPVDTPCMYDVMNECEDSKCNSTGSCVFAGNSSLCFDGNECTNDICFGNFTELTAFCGYANNTNNCTDDGVVCTLDYCDMGVCIHPPNNTFCGYLETNCTTAFFCNNSSPMADVNGCDADRLPAGSPCIIDEANMCEDSMCLASAACAFGSDSLLCDDNNECTLDMCNADPFNLTAVCEYQNITGGSCTVPGATGDCLSPTCLNGQCMFGGDSGLCDDGNPCTDDICITNATALTAICTFVNNDTNTCTLDGFGCTDDQCVSGTCVAPYNDTKCAYLGGNCTDAYFCDPTFPGHLADGCNANYTDFGTPCFYDVDNNDCESSTCDGLGGCEFASNSGFCNDLNVCTDEICQVNMTAHTAVCVYTNNTDPCSIAGSGSNCEDSMCAGGICVLAGNSGFCDDANECTDNVCEVNTTAVTAICTYPNNINNCTDDGYNCTNDYCQAGVCIHPPVHSYCSYLDDICTIDYFCNTSFPVIDAAGCGANYEIIGTPCEYNASNTCENSMCSGSGPCVFGTNATACLDPWQCTDNICVSDNILHTAYCDVIYNTSFCYDLFGNNTCLNWTICAPNNTMEPIGCINFFYPDGYLCNTTYRECANETCQSQVCVEELNVDLCVPEYNCTVPMCLANGTCIYIPDDALCSQYANDCTNATCAPGLENGPPGSGCYLTFAANGTSCSLTDGGMDSCESNSYCNFVGDCVLQTDQNLCWQHPCMPSICDNTTGLCIDYTDADGTPCDTDDAICSEEECQFGLCELVLYNDTVCNFLGIPQCNLNGTCDPFNRDLNDTGLGCRTFFRPVSYPCNTTTGECEDSGCDGLGTCVYDMSDLLCDDGNVCTMNVCVNGSCTYPNENNGFTCDDMIGETCADVCVNGGCESIANCSIDIVPILPYQNGTIDLSANDFGVDICLINSTGFPGTIYQVGASCEIEIEIAECNYGSYVITYLACNSTYDRCCECDIVIIPILLPPVVARDDYLLTQTMMNDVLDVLQNDTSNVSPDTLEVNGCGMVYPCVMPWGNVSVTLNNELYIEINNFVACEYNFTYMVCDNTTCGNCDNATVFLQILPLALDDFGSGVATANVSVNVTDNDKGTIASCFSNPVGLFPGWSYDFEGYPNCTSTIIPATCETGVISIEYTICACDNNTLCDSANVTFTITEGPPVIAIDDGAMTYVNVSVVIDVLFNDLGPVDPSTLNITIPPIHGTILSINYTTGEVVYEPDVNYFGMDSFEYEICDQPDRCHCDIGTVTIIILSQLGNYMVMDDCFEGHQNETIVGYPLLNDGPPAADGDSFVILITSPDGFTFFNTTSLEFTFVPFDPTFSGVTYATYVVCSSMDMAFCDMAVIKIYLIPDPIHIDPMPCGSDRLPLVHYYDAFPCLIPFL